MHKCIHAYIHKYMEKGFIHMEKGSYQCHLISFVDILLNRALHPSFYLMLAFAQWPYLLGNC